EPGLWDEDIIMEDEEDEEVEKDEEYEEDEPITLEQTKPHEDARFSEISEDESKQGDITDEEFEDNLTYPLSIDAENSSEITLDDAINDKMQQQGGRCHARFNFTDRTSLNVKYNLNIVSLLIKV